MKKILLFFAVVLVTAFSANAQYVLSIDGEPLGDTVTIATDDPTVLEIEFKVIFTNNSGHDANIKVARNEIELADDAESYFCWGACYPPSVDTSGSQMFIAAGASTMEGDFSAHYSLGAPGISWISYTFYNIDNVDEMVKVVVKFDTRPNGIDENILKNTWISELYPNPSTSFVNIDYSIPTGVESASVRVVNLVGSVVIEQTLDASSTNHNMNVSELKSGIYFYSLLLNEEVYSTKKLIVK